MNDAKKIQTLSLNILLEKLPVQKQKVLEEVVECEPVPALLQWGHLASPLPGTRFHGLRPRSKILSIISSLIEMAG